MDILEYKGLTFKSIEDGHIRVYRTEFKNIYDRHKTGYKAVMYRAGIQEYM